MTTDVKSMSVLAQLTADVMAEKKKASGLTPVAGEVAPSTVQPIPDVGAPFPHDHPTENVVAAIRNIRRELATIETALVVVEAAIAVPTPIRVATGGNVKADERAADAKAKDPAFADRFAKLSEDAQKATFQPDPLPVADAWAPVGWRCPTHGKATKKTSTNTGREFTGCPDCNLFERG